MNPRVKMIKMLLRNEKSGQMRVTFCPTLGKASPFNFPDGKSANEWKSFELSNSPSNSPFLRNILAYPCIIRELIFYAVRNVRSQTRSPKPYLKITSRRSARRKERARTIASFIRPLRRIRRTCVAGAAPPWILHARRSKGGEGGGVPESKFDPP